MADSPTPRSYRLPPLSVDGGHPDTQVQEGLHDITTLLIELRTQVRHVRNEIEELRVEEEKSKKGSIIPPSLRGAVTPRRALIAALLAVLTQLPEILDQLQQLLDQASK